PLSGILAMPPPPVFYTRWHALVLFALGVALAAFNGVLWWTAGRQIRAIWLAVPLLLLIGLAGLCDPRVLPGVAARGVANPGRAVGLVGGAGGGVGWVYYVG